MSLEEFLGVLEHSTEAQISFSQPLLPVTGQQGSPARRSFSQPAEVTAQQQPQSPVPTRSFSRSSPMSQAKKKRKSYTMAFKIKVLEARKSSQESRSKIADRFNVNESMLRKWEEKEMKIRGATSHSIRRMRQTARIKVGFFPLVDDKVFEWIKARNSRGICVRDRYIIAYAKKVVADFLQSDAYEGDKEKLSRFQCSKLWCQRFKNRFRLVSRRHTTTHSMPVGYRETAIKFIEDVHQIIEENGIAREHIINFDQVWVNDTRGIYKINLLFLLRFLAITKWTSRRQSLSVEQKKCYCERAAPVTSALRSLRSSPLMAK